MSVGYALTSVFYVKACFGKDTACIHNCLFFCLQSKLTLTPWVGLRKINVSYWCWEDMSPFTNSLLQWMPSEPSDAGFCGILSEPSTRGLKAATCINPLNGSVCERPGKDMDEYSALRGLSGKQRRHS